MLVQLNVASWQVKCNKFLKKKKLDGKEYKENLGQSSNLNSLERYLRSPQITLRTFRYLRFFIFSSSNMHVSCFRQAHCYASNFIRPLFGQKCNYLLNFFNKNHTDKFIFLKH